MVYEYDGCAIHHLSERFWQRTSRQFGPRSSFYRRIRQLVGAGYLQGRRLPPLLGSGGSGKTFIALGPKGRTLLAAYLDLPRSHLRRLRDIQTPYQGAHHLAVCDVRLWLELACDQAGPAVEFVEWIPEHELHQPPILKVQDPRPSYPGTTTCLIPLIPDGEFILRLPDGTSQGFRLELDMGTMAAKRVRAKLRGYLAHAVMDHRPLLWVVPDERRQQLLASWAMGEARDLGVDPTVFWITQRPQLSAETILTPVWQVVGGPRIALVPEQLPTPCVPVPQLQTADLGLDRGGVTWSL